MQRRVVAHDAEMDCHRRARNARSLAERREHLNLANRLARTSATLVGAFDKHRGKGQQKWTSVSTAWMNALIT